MPDVPPCCREADEPPCDQHRQSAEVLKHAGLRNRKAGAQRVIGEPGKAAPVREVEKP